MHLCSTPGEDVGIPRVFNALVFENLATENPEHNYQLTFRDRRCRRWEVIHIDIILLESLRINGVNHRQVKDFELSFLS